MLKSNFTFGDATYLEEVADEEQLDAAEGLGRVARLPADVVQDRKELAVEP